MVGDANWKGWSTLCDQGGASVAVGHYKLGDWYSCIVRGLAVKTEER